MSDTNQCFDAVIIGAGPAGSASAIELARAGRSVLVIEARCFPRHKVCGGCLSGSAVQSLERLLGSSGAIPGLPASRISFIVGKHRAVSYPAGRTWLSPRPALDECLAQAAAAEGVLFRFGQRAGLTRSASGWEVSVGDDRIQARTILLACGLSSLPQTIGILGRGAAAPMLGQQWIQPAVTPMPELGQIELHWLRGGYIGLATPEPDRCVVAMAVRQEAAAGQNAYHALRRLNPDSSVWDLLPENAPRHGETKGIAGFPWFPDRLGVDNVLLVGDAAGYAEPFSGEGIGLALRSARCAVRAVLDSGDMQNQYAFSMRAHRAALRRTRLISRLLDLVARGLLLRRRVYGLEPVIGKFVERLHVGVRS